MENLKGIGFVLVALLLATACAINRPITMPSEEVSRSEESAKKYAEKYEEVLGELRYLRTSLGTLRSEIAELRKLENGVARLRSETERLRNLEKHLAGLRVEIENLWGLEKAISSLQWQMERIRSFAPYVSSLQAEVARLGEELRSLEIRRPLGSYKLPQEISLCGERVPLEDRDVWENLDREFLSILANEAQVLLWMKRARR
jgi:DNA repair exonuclease SbcCD ATPase subunit